MLGIQQLCSPSNSFSVICPMLSILEKTDVQPAVCQGKQNLGRLVKLDSRKSTAAKQLTV